LFDTLTDTWASIVAALGARIFSIGETPVTAGGILRVLLAIAVAALLSRGAQSALVRISRRWPSTNQSAFYTLRRVIHYTILAMGTAVGLSTIGVDFTNFALLLGALGVGIGFGLQDMVANFISGLLILFERHVRVGDFLELESGVMGEVREIRMRATRLVTNDNIDILVPNSEFVRGRVVNWTLDESDRRIQVPFGVAYGSDKELVRKAVLEAADRVHFTLRDVPKRAPQVWLVGFGESSLDFRLVVWLAPDGVKRPNAVQAAYLWEIHSSLEQYGIEIPFPQRDLHVRSLFGLSQEASQALVARPAPPHG
jgi:small-conductance mechanosensitive channel